ncbi:Hypothetical protein D9617_19g102050 [Elsinoe fawcettii]|nr:Hypothetical protein D9617_19g102050 [Elsinoe fawcettii]
MPTLDDSLGDLSRFDTLLGKGKGDSIQSWTVTTAVRDLFSDSGAKLIEAFMTQGTPGFFWAEFRAVWTARRLLAMRELETSVPLYERDRTHWHVVDIINIMLRLQECPDCVVRTVMDSVRSDPRADRLYRRDADDNPIM